MTDEEKNFLNSHLMNKEEKQAIEFLRKRQDFMHSEPKCVTTLEESIDILLNLTQKLDTIIKSFETGEMKMGEKYDTKQK